MALRNLRKEFGVAIGAGEPAIRIDTDEIEDCLKTLTSVCKKNGWEMRVFDALIGTKWYVGEPPPKNQSDGGIPTKKDAGSLLNAMNGGEGPGGAAKPPPNIPQALMDFWREQAKPDKATPGDVAPIVLVVKNFHLGFERAKEPMINLVQHLVSDRIMNLPEYDEVHKKHLYDPHEIPGDLNTGKFVVGLMPAEAKLPPEVDPLFKKLTHELPDEEELRTILDGVISTSAAESEDDEDNPNGLTSEDRKKVCKFALGLTRLQAEGVFASCKVSNQGRIVPDYVWKAKSDILNKEGLIELYQGTEKFKDVIGLDGAKAFLKGLLTPDPFDDSDPDCRAKGVLYVGPPGAGKSLLAKAAGNEFGFPILMINPSNLKGSYVGESEKNTRKMFQILRAHAPCIAVVDEVEKVMPKSRGGGGDSGVSAAMEGTFLTHMNDMKEQVFWCFTANDVKGMHEAFFRAERVDGVFYVRLPGPEQRAGLWKLYAKKFFPKEALNGKDMVPFPRYANLNLGDLLDELKKAKKVNAKEWAEKLTIPLLCIADRDKRAEQVEKIKEVNENVGGFLKEVNDEGWSPAEIRSCCRLARKLKEPVSKTQSRIRPVSVSAAKVIAGLEEWASESALDAETGETYVQPQAEDAETGEKVDNRVVKHGKSKVRRKVRHQDD